MAHNYHTNNSGHWRPPTHVNNNYLINMTPELTSTKYNGLNVTQLEDINYKPLRGAICYFVWMNKINVPMLDWFQYCLILLECIKYRSFILFLIP